MKNNNENIVIKPEVNIQIPNAAPSKVFPAQPLTNQRPQEKTTVNNANTELQALQAQMMNSFNMFFRLLAQYRDGMQMRVKVWGKSCDGKAVMQTRYRTGLSFNITSLDYHSLCLGFWQSLALPLPCLAFYVLHSSAVFIKKRLAGIRVLASTLQADWKTVWIQICCLLRSQLIWIYTVFKTGYFHIQHGKGRVLWFICSMFYYD